MRISEGLKNAVSIRYNVEHDSEGNHYDNAIVGSFFSMCSATGSAFSSRSVMKAAGVRPTRRLLIVCGIRVTSTILIAIFDRRPLRMPHLLRACLSPPYGH